MSVFPAASLTASAPELSTLVAKDPWVMVLIVHVRLFVPSPVNPVVVRPVRLFTSAVVIGLLKMTLIPVICQGRSKRVDPIRL